MLLEIAVAVALTAAGVGLAPIYDSLERKVRARLHSRVGPPILQTWYDILKLLRKELVIPEGGYFTAAVVLTELGVSVGLLLAASFMLMMPSLTTYVLTAVFLSALSAVTMVKSVSQNNLFSIIGGFREYSIVLSSEPFLIFLILLIGSAYVRGCTDLRVLVGLAPLYLTTYVMTARVPFDIAEAEPEIASGIMIELSGPTLAANELSLLIKRYVMAALPTYLILPIFINSVAIKAGVGLAAALITWVIYGVVAVLHGRSRAAVMFKGTSLTALALTTLFIIVELIPYG